MANVPGYNPLDRAVPSPPPYTKTNKYPYAKTEKITTTAMKKPKVTSTGVLPNPRNTSDMPDLNIILEGQPPEILTSRCKDDIAIVKGVNETRNLPDTAQSGKRR